MLYRPTPTGCTAPAVTVFAFGTSPSSSADMIHPQCRTDRGALIVLEKEAPISDISGNDRLKSLIQAGARPVREASRQQRNAFQPGSATPAQQIKRSSSVLTY